MPKVREVFAKAYGPIPEGATCHVGFINGFDEGVVGPTYCHDKSRVYSGGLKDGAGQWGWEISEGIYGGDISKCDAAAFSPVFQCAAYDAALDALTKEEARKPTPMPRWMQDQFDNAEKTVATWSPGKRKAAGMKELIADAREEMAKGEAVEFPTMPDPGTVIALADVTVKDVFLKAYCGVGPEPDEMACYVGAHDDPVYGLLPVPMMYCVIEETTQDDRNILEGEIVGHYFAWTDSDEGWVAEDAICASTMQTDEITNFPAYAFSPVFKCELYDKALRELTEQRAEDSIHPDEIIKIANALAKFVLEGTGSAGVTVEDVAGYYLKASGVYERVSADGTGESPVLSTHLDVMGEGK